MWFSVSPIWKEVKDRPQCADSQSGYFGCVALSTALKLLLEARLLEIYLFSSI